MEVVLEPYASAPGASIEWVEAAGANRVPGALWTGQGEGRAGAAGRDEDADGRAGFAAAYVAHRAAIHGYVRRMLPDEADAEDVTVAAFEKALRAWARRPPDGALRPWLFRIATNACLDELRRRERVRWQPWDAFVRLFHPSQVAPQQTEEHVLRQETAALVRAALATLSPRDRAALVLRECQGLSVEEVGTALKISPGAAKVALFRARERLRSAYRRLGGEPPAGAGSSGGGGV